MQRQLFTGGSFCPPKLLPQLPTARVHKATGAPAACATPQPPGGVQNRVNEVGGPCPEGFYSLQGSMSPTPCPAGTFSGQHRWQCPTRPASPAHWIHIVRSLARPLPICPIVSYRLHQRNVLTGGLPASVSAVHSACNAGSAGFLTPNGSCQSSYSCNSSATNSTWPGTGWSVPCCQLPCRPCWVFIRS